MKKNGDKEHWIEVWDDGSRADDSAPRQAHSPVGKVVRLAWVCPPAASQQAVTTKQDLIHLENKTRKTKGLTHGQFEYK